MISVSLAQHDSRMRVGATFAFRKFPVFGNRTIAARSVE
jgi:hypothetical protein